MDPIGGRGGEEAPDTKKRRTRDEERVADLGKRRIPNAPHEEAELMGMDTSEDEDDLFDTSRDSPLVVRKNPRSEDEVDGNLRADKRGKATVSLFKLRTGLSVAIAPDVADRMTDEEFAHQIGEFRQISDIIVNGANELTDAGIIRSTMGNTMLQSLCMIECKNITEWALQVVSKQCPNIRSLSVIHCNNVTDAGMQSVATNCKGLQELHLDKSRRFTDQTLLAVAKGCPDLRLLTLTDCLQYSQSAFMKLVKGCSQLRYLSLRGCSQVDDGWIEGIIQHCPNLRNLDVSGCTNISDYALERLSEHFGSKFNLIR